MLPIKTAMISLQSLNPQEKIFTQLICLYVKDKKLERTKLKDKHQLLCKTALCFRIQPAGSSLSVCLLRSVLPAIVRPTQILGCVS